MREPNNTTDITTAYVFIKTGMNITHSLAAKVTVILQIANRDVGDVLVECDSANNSLSTFLTKLKRHANANQRVAVFYIKLLDNDQLGLKMVSDGDPILTSGIIKILQDTFDTEGDLIPTDEIIGVFAEVDVEDATE